MSKCLHPNRTMLRGFALTETETVRMMCCDDCGHIWAEHEFTPETPPQVCDGNCIDCGPWKEPSESEVTQP